MVYFGQMKKVQSLCHWSGHHGRIENSYRNQNCKIKIKFFKWRIKNDNFKDTQKVQQITLSNADNLAFENLKKKYL